MLVRHDGFFSRFRGLSRLQGLHAPVLAQGGYRRPERSFSLLPVTFTALECPPPVMISCSHGSQVGVRFLDPSSAENLSSISTVTNRSLSALPDTRLDHGRDSFVSFACGQVQAVFSWRGSWQDLPDPSVEVTNPLQVGSPLQTPCVL